MSIIEINKRKIGEAFPPYIIAELSANHNGSFDNACKLIELAKQAGADAAKIQTYKPDTITIQSDRPEFKITEGRWSGYTLYDLYQWAHTPWEWHAGLFDKANEVGITIFSSPFDKTAVDLLEDLGAPAYKIASFEAVDIPLIKYAASTGKPLIISTGMANLQEITEAVDAARSAGCKQLALLHCVSSYPAMPGDYNLKTIQDIKDKFRVVVGLSDHTIDNATATASIALGASLVEKHFTLDRNGGGPDDSFSLEPDDLTSLCESTKIAWEAMGEASYRLKESEKLSVLHRRSIYSIQEIRRGDVFSETNIKVIRPGLGLPPREFEGLLGKVATVHIPKGYPLNRELAGLEDQKAGSGKSDS